MGYGWEKAARADQCGGILVVLPSITMFLMASNQATASLSRVQLLERRCHLIGGFLPQRATGAPPPGKFNGRERLRPGTDLSHSFAVLSKSYRLVAVQNGGQHFSRFTPKLSESSFHDTKVHTVHT